MGINMNLTGVEPWSANTVLSPGSHTVRVIEAEEKPANTGTPQIILQMEAISGAEAGGKIRDWIAITEKCLGRVAQIMQAFGMPIPQGNFSLEAQSFVGKVATVIVRSEPGRKDPSKTFSKVAAYEQADSNAGGAPAPSDDPFVQGQQNGQGPVPAAAGGFPDDDIPF